MTTDQPNPITSIYHAALARPVGDRAAFLTEACEGDVGSHIHTH
jgi:hypothetical protein